MSVALTSPAAPGDAGAQAAWTVVGVAGTTAAAIVGTTALALDDSGAVFSVDQSSAYTITLPTPVANPGLRYLFHLTAPGAFTVAIATAGGSFVGSIVLDASVIEATAATSIDFDSGALLGDNVECISSGSLWFVRAVSSAAAGISVT